jgi:hypothetical protein
MTRDELRRVVKFVAGYVFVAVVPDQIANQMFAWFLKRRQAEYQTRPNDEQVIQSIRVMLGDQLTDNEVLEYAMFCTLNSMEDTFGRWQASHRSDWRASTEVIGLEHLNRAFDQGRGAVLWGMSFCGTLFPKIALSRAGVALTQLSSEDHGADYPMSLMGKWVIGPLHCLPESRYLSERIRIPEDGNTSYLRRIGEVLQSNGCVWIAGERSRTKKPHAAELHGRQALFPVGAPMLALRYKAALLPVHTERLGQFHYRVTIESPITLSSRMGRREAIPQAVQEYARRLAIRIRDNPGD